MGHSKWFGSFEKIIGNWCVDFGDGGVLGGYMYFGFVGVERFDGWYFEGEGALKDWCFEEGWGLIINSGVLRILRS